MLLLEMCEGASVDDEATKKRVIDALEAANAQQPNYSAILKQHVLFLHSNELPRTVKGTIRRCECETSMGSELDALFSGLKCSPLVNEIAHHLDTDRQVLSICASTLPDLHHNPKASFVELGMSSVEGVGIVNALNRQFHCRLPETLAMETPSVDELVTTIRALLGREDESSGLDVDTHVFSAHQLFCPRKEHVPGTTRTQYGMDNGQHGYTYTYNSLGWRGEEFDPQCKYHIFVFGASGFHGTGTHDKGLFVHSLRDLIAQRDGILPDTIGISNFACGGPPPSFTLRSAIAQCSRVKPNLVLFEVHSNTEDWAGDWSEGSAPDKKSDENKSEDKQSKAPASKAQPNPLQMCITRCILGYMSLQQPKFVRKSPAPGRKSDYARLQQMVTYVALHKFFEAEGIPAIACGDFDELLMGASGAVKTLHGLIDPTRQFSHQWELIDGEGCRGHSGPEGHRRMASSLLKYIPANCFGATP